MRCAVKTATNAAALPVPSTSTTVGAMCGATTTAPRPAWDRGRSVTRSRCLAGIVVSTLVVAGCVSSNASDSTVATVATTAADTADSLLIDSVWCDQAVEVLSSSSAGNPDDLLTDLEEIPRNNLDPAAEGRVDAALRQSREALDRVRTTTGSYEWSASTIVETANEICNSSIEPFSVAIVTQT